MNKYLVDRCSFVMIIDSNFLSSYAIINKDTSICTGNGHTLQLIRKINRSNLLALILDNLFLDYFGNITAICFNLPKYHISLDISCN